MHQARTHIPLMVLLGFFLYVVPGCKKSTAYSIPPSSTYRFAQYTGIQPFRAFIHTGEIKDTAILAQLLSANSLYLSESAIQGPQDIPPYDSLHFETAGTGIAYGYAYGPWEFTTRRSGNSLTFMAIHPQPQDIDTSLVSSVGAAMVLYPYLLANRRYDAGPFYLYDWTYEAFGTQTAPDKIQMPVLISGLLVPAAGFLSRAYNNRFNPAFHANILPPGDTLIFREFSMVMQKE